MLLNDEFNEKIAKTLSELEGDRTPVDYDFEFDSTIIKAREYLKKQMNLNCFKKLTI